MAVDPNDLDMMARTIVAENANGSPEEYAAIANVMRNRLRSGDPQYGVNTMSGILRARNQFTPWNNPRAKNYPTKVSPDSPAYKSAYQAASDAMSGNAPDPTGGAVYYYNPKAPGQKTPDWAAGRQGQQIGAHKFYGPLVAAKDEHPDLMADAPDEPKQAPSQVAGEGVAPGGGDKHADLMQGAPPEPNQPSQRPQPTTVAESVQQSRQQGQGIADTVRGAFQTLIRQHPTAATAIGTTAALNTGIPLAGLAATGVNMLPLWAQALGGYTAYQAGIPQEVRSLWDLVRSSVPH